MSVEHHLLHAVLAFEDDLIDLQQLVAVCQLWAADKSRPVADYLVEQGWVTADDRAFLEKQVERKLAKHQDDARVVLNTVIRGDVCDELLNKISDSDIHQSLSSWPDATPVLIETLGQTVDEAGQPRSRYTWISEVGAGGLGKVWLARDNDLAREVALKEIRPGSASDGAIRRLIKEAQITGQLQHPGIVPVYEVNHERRPFYTMKLVKGRTLSRAIREHHELEGSGSEREMSMRRLLGIFVNVCDAIAYAHSRGVIHRDLKPENVVLGDFGEAIVLDWGLARQLHAEEEDIDSVIVTEDAQTEATQAGQRLGTPAYMAPEQAAGRVDLMDQRTDVYGLGTILFEILTGQPPHKIDRSRESATDQTELLQPSIVALLDQIVNGPTPIATDITSGIPDELSSLCATAMAANRGDRFQTAAEVKEALLQFQVHEESIELTANAQVALAGAVASRNYEGFSRARFGFETAIEQWPENQTAVQGLRETRTEFARTAFARGDYDLALSLLDQSEPAHEDLRTSIESSARDREARRHHVRRLRRVSVATSVTVALVAIIAAVWINYERENAITAQQNEAAAAARATEAAGRAEKNAQDAIRERDAATLARLKGLEQQSNDSVRNAWDAYANGDRETMLLWLATALRESQEAKRIVDSSPSISTSDKQRVLSLSALNSLRAADAVSDFPLAAVWDDATCACFSSDGRLVATGNRHGMVSVWDTETGRPHCGPFSHSPRIQSDENSTSAVTNESEGSTVISVAFSDDNLRIVSTAVVRTVQTTSCHVCVWDIPSGRQVQLKTSGRHTGLACFVDGHVVTTNGVTVQSFSAEDGRPLGGAIEFAAAGVDVMNAVLSMNPYGASAFQVAACTESSLIALVDVRKRPAPNTSAPAESVVTITRLPIDSRPEVTITMPQVVTCVEFSPDEAAMATGTLDGAVQVWDVASGKAMTEPFQHPVAVRDVAFRGDSKCVVVGCSNESEGRSSGFGMIRVWDVESQMPVTESLKQASPVSSVSYSPNNRFILSSGYAFGPHETETRMWRVDGTERRIGSLKLENIDSAVYFTHSGNRFISGRASWRTSSLKEIETPEARNDSVQFQYLVAVPMERVRTYLHGHVRGLETRQVAETQFRLAAR